MFVLCEGLFTKRQVVNIDTEKKSELKMNSSEFPRIPKTPQESLKIPKNSQSSPIIPKNHQDFSITPKDPPKNPSMIQDTTTVAGEARGFIVAARFHRGHLSGWIGRWFITFFCFFFFFLTCRTSKTCIDIRYT